MDEVDGMIATPDPPIASKDLASELSPRVTAIQPLINLEKEPVATDVEEEPEATVSPITV